jgi:hypothetical protein
LSPLSSLFETSSAIDCPHPPRAQWFVVLSNAANLCTVVHLLIAEPLGGKKGEPFLFAHMKANKGKKNDEKIDTARQGRRD